MHNLTANIHHDLTTSIRGEHIFLSGEKALYWPGESLLVISDMHLGKTDHFRKNGIAMPGNVITRELERLASLVRYYEPTEVLFLGDLFHSVYNISWELAVQSFQSMSGVQFSFVEGNHDIMDQDHYDRAGLRNYGIVYQKGPFLFAHDRIDDLPSGLYGVFGHVHPGVRLEGPGRQTIMLPCFCFREDHALMPAFGAFTGLARIKANENDRVFGVAGQKVLEL